MTGERAHARLGASNAARWMACPGSVKLSEQAPPKPPSPYAEEGTRAHKLAELALVSGKSPAAWQGDYPDDMIGHVAGYVNFVREKSGVATYEHRFSLHELDPPEPMFGTADVTIYDRGRQHLDVIDLKYGAGYTVEVEGNPQTRFYALGAMLSQAEPVSTVTSWIYQPRAPHKGEPWRSETIDGLELLDWSASLMAAARVAVSDGAPLNAGSWCQWCPAAVICPVLQAAVTELARNEWAEEPADTEQLGRWLDLALQAEEFIKPLRMHAHRTLASGGKVEGWKLVRGKASRAWRDLTEAENILEGLVDDIEAVWVRKLISPAQAERLLPKADHEVFHELIVSSTPGLVLAPMTDKRPAAAVSAADEFADVADGDSEE